MGVALEKGRKKERERGRKKERKEGRKEGRKERESKQASKQASKHKRPILKFKLILERFNTRLKKDTGSAQDAGSTKTYDKL